jgi:hypothetical protein
MSANDLDTVVGTYLERLDLALSAMPAPKRDQLVEEIAQHVAEGRRQLGEESPAALLQLLDRIGRPEDIAAAAFAGCPTVSLSACCCSEASFSESGGWSGRYCCGHQVRGGCATNCLAPWSFLAAWPCLCISSRRPRDGSSPRGPAWSFWQCS